MANFSKSFLIFCICIAMVGCKENPAAKTKIVESASRNLDAKWPWRNAKLEQLHNGVRQWRVDNSSDGSFLNLIEFDFKKNPKLRFEMYDQDEDDKVPFDNEAEFYTRNAAHIASHLKSRGKIIAVWNGLFHGYDRTSKSAPPQGFANHIGLNTIRGVTRYNVGSFRWGFGVEQTGDRGIFKLACEPTKADMQRQFDFGAVGAQVLLFENMPLFLEPFTGQEAPKGTPLKPTKLGEAGHIANVDFWKTSRVSMAWNWDSTKFYLLSVQEKDDEVSSKRSLRDGFAPNDSGWTLRDLQLFWISFGVDFAVNSDGGVVTQVVNIKPTGQYDFLPPRWAFPHKRLEFDINSKNIPIGGGTLMSWYIVEK